MFSLLLILLAYAAVTFLTTFASVFMAFAFLGAPPSDSQEQESRIGDFFSYLFITSFGFFLIWGINYFIPIQYLFEMIICWGGSVFIGACWSRVEEIKKAKQFAERAKVIELEDSGDPLRTEKLSEALELYKQHNQLVLNTSLRLKEKILAEKLDKLEKFKNIYEAGIKKFEQKYYYDALNLFQRSRMIFYNKKVNDLIRECEKKIEQQQQYDVSFTQAKLVASEGNFEGAIAILDQALSNFTDENGKVLLKKLEKTVKAEEKYAAGLAAEEKQDWQLAAQNYQEALLLVPQLTPATIRLGVIAIKKGNYQQAIIQLKDALGEEAAYLRGFAYAQQKQWQSTRKEWQNVSNFNIQQQKELLKELAQRERLLCLKTIEDLVNEGKLSEAKTASLEFSEKFGPDETVVKNLRAHIEARLEAQIWESEDYQKIALMQQESWLANPNITTLHNWACASYYSAKDNFKSLENLIRVWGTALANLEQDSSLKNSLWQGSRSINYLEIQKKLTTLLEGLIGKIKDKNINAYFRLRDIYRLELVALNYIKTIPPEATVKINQLNIMPGCYLLTNNNGNNVNLAAQIYGMYGSLYTPWGIAVAACVEGDVTRALQIKFIGDNSSAAEKYGSAFVSYHEGCYNLQQQNWREAVKLLASAKKQISFKQDWQEEINKLCLSQRQEIKNLEEHVEFAQAWYDLASTKEAKTYLVEYKARKIIKELVYESISEEKALSQLKELKKMDSNHPVLLDLINRIEKDQEMEQVKKLLKAGEFEKAVQKAKYSSNEEVRYLVAEIFAKILLENAKDKKLPYTEVMRLGYWVYELCPDEPAFEPLFRGLNLY